MTHTVKDIAAALGAKAFGAVDLCVTRATEPALAGPDDLALAMSPRFADDLGQGAARAAVVWDGCDWQSLGLEAVIIAPRARLAMAGLTSMLDDAAGFVPGVHPTAHIEADAVIGDGASIGAFTYIAGAAQIGSNARIAAHVSIGQEAVIGDDALIHAGVQIAARVRIGDRFVCQMGAVIGGDGFSFVTADPSAAEQVRGNLGTAPIIVPTDPTWHRIHSLGSVVIADDVEIGANTCVDAGTVRPTHVGRGTKIDNLVQIGHNAVLGQDCLICGQSGVAGSAVIGDRTVLGGRTAIADNLTVGADVVTGVGTTIMSNVAKGRMMLGYPAVKMDAHVDGYKALRRLPRTLEAIKVRLGKLEQG